MAYDWAGGNWYFLDLSQEIILLCHYEKEAEKMNVKCKDIISRNLTKPRSISLDPSEGKYF